jgi:alkylhydroperoxidase/carboxymuconolactone decarboxylase family protein YurZ
MTREMTDQTHHEEASMTDAQDESLHATQRALAAERGYHFPTFEWLGEADPEYEQARLDFVRMNYTRPRAELPVRYRELVACAILAFRGYGSLKLHLARAMREGASLREVLEAMEVASVPGGMATLHYAVDQLIAIEREDPDLIASARARRGREAPAVDGDEA